MKKVTMQDIADQLNISKNSVSQALRDKNGVSTETKELILKTAKKLGYQYNKQIESTQSTPKSIVFIASDFVLSFGLYSRNFFSNIYLSIEQEVTQLNWNLLLQPINNEQKNSLILPPCIQDGKIDGIIILSHLTDEYIEKLIQTGLPTVIIDHHYPGVQADCILTNNRYGAFQAVEHFIQLGHQEIGFIGNTRFSPSYQERFEGYSLAFQKYNLPLPDKKFMMTTINESESDVFTYLNTLDKQPTAWFCVNDGLSFFTYSYLQQNNYQIPNDISLCSYDNGDLSRLANPKITTLDIDLTYYGKCSFDQLLWRMDNPDEPFRELLLPSTLIKRESTDIPPKK